jgi:phosphatidylserine synthase
MGMMRLYWKDLVTLISLVCAVASAALAFENQLQLACFFIWLAWVFDGLDGVVARLTKQKNAIGPHLDATVDFFSSAVVPGLLAYVAYKPMLGVYGAFAVGSAPILFGALRHARSYGNPSETTNYWMGLPRTYSGLAIAGLLGSHVFAWEAGRWAGLIVVVILPALGLTTIPWQGRHHKGLKPHQIFFMSCTFATFLAGLVMWALGHGVTWFLDGLLLWMMGYTVLAGSVLIPAEERKAHYDYVAEWRKNF